MKLILKSKSILILFTFFFYALTINATGDRSEKFRSGVSKSESRSMRSESRNDNSQLDSRLRSGDDPFAPDGRGVGEAPIGESIGFIVALGLAYSVYVRKQNIQRNIR